MLKNMKIGSKILVVILTISLGTLLMLFGSFYYYMTNLTDDLQQSNIDLGLSASESSKQALQKQAEEYINKIAQKQAEGSNALLAEIDTAVENASMYINSLYEKQNNFKGRKLPLPNEVEDKIALSKYMLAPEVVMTKEIEEEIKILSNCEYLFGPSLENNDMLNNIYAGTETGISYRYSRSNSYDPSYDPRKRDWYKMAMKSPDEIVWLNTYKDSFGNTCITTAKTFRDKSGNIRGVVAADIALQDMLDEIVGAKIGETGYAFLLDKDMQYIAHPNFFEEGFNKLLTSNLAEEDQEMMDIIAEESKGTVKAKLSGVESYISFATLEETGWKLCISIDVAEVIAPALDTKGKIDASTENTRAAMQDTLTKFMLKFIVFFAIVGIVVIMVSFAVAGTITRPIQKLARSVSVIGKGELDSKIEVESNDEVGELAGAFNKMLGDLKLYINNIQDITAEKERIGAELNVATQIQANMLPRIFPPYPHKREFDLYASMEPAKEVGGDFYDFFMTDDDHLAFVIGDVSGKGVPAALFMVISKTMIKNYASMGLGVDEIFTRTNKDLSEGNDAGYFTTSWIGIYELSTGKLSFADAGHEIPIKRKPNGDIEYIKPVKKKMMLAGMDTTQYLANETILEEGDLVLIYTDGVPEATNEKNEFYKMERLENCVRNSRGGAKQLIEEIRRDVGEFVGEAPQFDDLTMLALEVKERGIV